MFVGDPGSGLKRFIFWDYRRAVWQYDVMVGIILLFIFLMPREWFHDQLRASSIVMVKSPHSGTSEFWIEPEELAGVPDADKQKKAAELVKSRFKKQVVQFEPIFNSEDEIRGYMAYTKP